MYITRVGPATRLALHVGCFVHPVVFELSILAEFQIRDFGTELNSFPFSIPVAFEDGETLLPYENAIVREASYLAFGVALQSSCRVGYWPLDLR